jgi:flagellar hook-associated protein 2
VSAPLDGLASGLSTTALINQLIQLERAPQQRLVSKFDVNKKMITAFQTLNTKLTQLRSAGQAMAKPSAWNAMKATSSDTSVATATAAEGALPGTLSFTVANLATAGSLASASTVSSTAAVVSTGTLLLATGTTSMGVRSVKADVGLAVGDHEITVLQETVGAVKTGTAPLAGSTVITAGVNDTISLEVDGVPVADIVLDAGTYTAQELADEVTAQSGGALTASVDGTGALQLTTVDEGSAATLRITGGNALASLSLAVDGAAIVGTDGEVDVDGVSAVVTDARAGATQTVNNVVLTYASGLRSGSATTTAISTGDGSLAATVAAINAVKKGIAAAAVNVGGGAYRLQLSATTTGLDGDVAVAADAFTNLGGLVSNSTAADATLTIGTGPGAYSVTSGTNQVTGVLQGVTMTLKTTGAVTVTVASDSDKLAAGVASLVDLANTAIGEIKSQTGFNATTGTGGLLMGNLTVRTLQTNLITSVVNAVTTSALGSSSLAGLSTTKDGTLTFDKAKFLAAYQDDPEAVASLFRQGADIDDPAAVSFVSATDRTMSGTYAVVTTVAAERAEAAGATTPAGSDIAAAETIEVRIGGKTVTYAAQAGETLTSIADGLNALLADEGMNMVATVEAGSLTLRTTGYGASATFDVRSTIDNTDPEQSGLVAVAGVWETHTGVDVAGTINGVVATGKGQFLTAPADDEDLAGLILQITATVPGAHGNVEYVPGVAQRLASVANNAVDTVTGSLAALIEGRNTENDRLTDQIERWEVRIANREKALRRQFSAMEIALSRMQGQSQWLAGQINSLNSLNNSGN